MTEPARPGPERPTRPMHLRSIEALPAALERRVARAILLTWAGEAGQRVLVAFWPALSVLLMTLALWGFGILELAPAPIRPWIVPALLALTGFLAWRGRRRFDWPAEEEILARIDQPFEHAPLQTLTDDLAIGSDDPTSRALWQLHRQRALAEVEKVTPHSPPPRIARADWYGLRLLALTLAIAAILFGDLSRLPPLPSSSEEDGAAGMASFEGWIVPPGYTGRPTLYLAPDSPAPELPPLPQGSILVLRFYDTPPSISQTVSPTAPEAGGSAGELRLSLQQGGQVRFKPAGGTAVTLDVRIIPDAMPSPRFPEPARRADGGAFEIPWAAADDYGLASARLILTLDETRLDRRHGLAKPPEAAAPITIPLEPGFGSKGEDGNMHHGGTARLELLRHLWAGLPVRITLEVTDAAGQSARAVQHALLPRPPFYEPLAAALIEQRRDLLWNAENRPRVARLLRAITWNPEDLDIRPRAWLLLRRAIGDLERSGSNGDDREAIAEALWKAAELIEHGDAADALARLERAEKRLAAALKRGADPAEIADLTQELQKAMEAYMRALAARQQAKGEKSAAGEDTLSLTPEDLAALLRRIEELSRQGRTAEAEALLRQLAELMRNMRITEGGNGGLPGGKAEKELRERLEEQEGLAEETFRSLQDRFSPREPGEEGTETRPSPSDLARRQEAIRRSLDGLEGELGRLGENSGDSREGVRRAERAMREAKRRLEEGDLDGALDAEAEALAGLRESLRALGEARSGQAGKSGTPGENGRDPLGRRVGGKTAGEGVEIPEGPELRRKSREIIEEIRRRSSEYERPERERRYLQELVAPFRK